LDNFLIRALQFVNVSNFVVTDYKVDAGTPQPRGRSWLPTGPLKLDGDHVELPDNTYKGAGDIFSQELGIGMRLSINLSPNQNYDGLNVEGDAFSNELRVGWKLEGAIDIIVVSGIVQLQV